MPEDLSNNDKANTLNSNNVTLDRNNPAYKAAQDNRSQQLNPQSPKCQGKRP